MDKVYTRFSSDQNGAKTLPDGAAHTYIAYIREYPPPTPAAEKVFKKNKRHKRLLKVNFYHDNDFSFQCTKEM